MNKVHSCNSEITPSADASEDPVRHERLATWLIIAQMAKIQAFLCKIDKKV